MAGAGIEEPKKEDKEEVSSNEEQAVQKSHGIDDDEDYAFTKE